MDFFIQSIQELFIASLWLITTVIAVIGYSAVAFVTFIVWLATKPAVVKA